MIVQGWERSLKTSVNKLLFAGSRMSVLSSGAFPVYDRASTLRSASRMGREFPCRGCAPAIARDLSSPDHAPALGSLKVARNVPHTPLGRLLYLAATRASVMARLIAHMKPASSRATAVMATVFTLPRLVSAR
jgi:hypothetical protein